MKQLNEVARMQQLAGIQKEIKVKEPNLLQVDMFEEEDIDYPIIILNNDDKQYEGMLRGDEILFNTSWGEDDMDIVENELKNIFSKNNILYQIQNDDGEVWVVIDKKAVKINNKNINEITINKPIKKINLYQYDEGKFEDDNGYQFEEEDGDIKLYTGDGDYNKEFKRYVKSLKIPIKDFEEREYDGDIYTFYKSNFNIIE